MRAPRAYFSVLLLAVYFRTRLLVSDLLMSGGISAGAHDVRCALESNCPLKADLISLTIRSP